MAETFRADAVENWLATNLPAWQLQKSHLRRLYKTGNWRVTLMVANAIGYLAEAADHGADRVGRTDRSDLGQVGGDFLDGAGGAWDRFTHRTQGQLAGRLAAVRCCNPCV